MSQLRIIPLFSGSGGNCTYITGGGAHILIDAGVSARRIARALSTLGLTLSRMDAVFITHEHRDHIAALPVLQSKLNASIHMTGPSYACAVLPAGICTHDCIYTEQVGPLTVSSFPLSHDTACCVGYTVRLGGERVGIMTDTGYVTDEAVASLVGCEQVLVESNHDEQMLRNGPYPRVLQNRILSEHGHLSNRDCARFCAFLASHGTKAITLAHISRENNTPALALACTREAIEDTDVRIDCAPEAII